MFLDQYNPGPDEILQSLLKYSSTLLSSHLTLISNRFMELGIFMGVLKSSFVIPMHKSSDVDSVWNYIHTTTQTALSKVFEYLVLVHISFSCRGIKAPVQLRFMSGKFVTTNLVLFTKYILSPLGNSLQVEKPNIVCVTEHNLKSYEFDVINWSGSLNASAYCHPSSQGGGVGNIYKWRYDISIPMTPWYRWILYGGSCKLVAVS